MVQFSPFEERRYRPHLAAIRTIDEWPSATQEDGILIRSVECRTVQQTLDSTAPRVDIEPNLTETSSQMDTTVIRPL